MPPDTSENSEEREKRGSTKTYMQRFKFGRKEEDLSPSWSTGLRGGPVGRIGIPLLITGSASLIASVLVSSSVLAFIGLGLTFWGALFFFVRPIKFVRGTLLDSTAISAYQTVDRIISDFEYEGKALYIPPYPSDVYLPEHLKGLKEMIVLISSGGSVTTPPIEELVKEPFILKNPEGICITPPGIGITRLLEEELRMDFTKVNLEDLADTLLTLVVTNLELATNVEVRNEGDGFHVKIEDCAFQNLYSPTHGLRSIHLLGGPLASAIACAISKATGKAVTITKDVASSDLKTIELWYQTLKG